MQEEVYQKDRNGEALKSGLILGLISIILIILFYIIDISMLSDWKTGLITSAISIGFVAYMGRKYRDEEAEGFLTFKESFLYSYVVFFISSIVSAAFLILLYEVIDPQAPQILMEKALENSEKMMRSFGMSEEKLEEALQQAESDLSTSFSATGIIKNSWFYFISSAILSLITGLIIKKSKPDFA